MWWVLSSPCYSDTRADMFHLDRLIQPGPTAVPRQISSKIPGSIDLVAQSQAGWGRRRWGLDFFLGHPLSNHHNTLCFFDENITCFELLVRLPDHSPTNSFVLPQPYVQDQPFMMTGFFARLHQLTTIRSVHRPLRNLYPPTSSVDSPAC